MTDLLAPRATPDERATEGSLRPRHLRDFVGQARTREQLAIVLESARRRGTPPDHLLFSGPPGLGKTSLAAIVANELEAGFRVTSGPVLERAGDLAAILTGLEPGDVMFVDEIHRLPRAVEEVLYPAMEDFQIDVVLGKGPGARSLRLDLPRFTLVAATTRTGLITSPLRDRFGFSARLDFYRAEDLRTIVSRSATILGVEVDPEGAEVLARRSRGTPRIANRLLRRVRGRGRAVPDPTGLPAAHATRPGRQRRRLRPSRPRPTPRRARPARGRADRAHPLRAVASESAAQTGPRRDGKLTHLASMPTIAPVPRPGGRGLADVRSACRKLAVGCWPETCSGVSEVLLR